MTRRELLKTGMALSIVDVTRASADTPGGQKAILGGSPTTFNVRSKAAHAANQPFDILEYCHQLGLAGAESILTNPTPEMVRATRDKVESYGMTLVLNAPLPKTEADVAAFDASVKARKEAGAVALHIAMTHRRYEQYPDLAAFKADFGACQRSIAMAEPVLRKHKIRLAIENHKGWRAAEQSKWLKQLSSEWVGVCLDMGNNLALCEPVDETFEALTPFTVFSHIKDMGLQDYADGFLLSEVPFGHGVIDLKKRVAQLRQKDPGMLFCLEMITRDPLKIPVFTEAYWKTFSDGETQIPAQDLARVLALVRANPPKEPLPTVEHLTTAEAMKAEDENNLACIRYARQVLEM